MAPGGVLTAEHKQQQHYWHKQQQQQRQYLKQCHEQMCKEIGSLGTAKAAVIDDVRGSRQCLS